MGSRPAVTAPAFPNGSEAHSGARRVPVLADGVTRLRELNPTKPIGADGVIRTVDRTTDVWIEDATGPPGGSGGD